MLFYNGSNPLALAAFSAGANGWCTAAPNLIPELNVELYNAIQNNDLETARQLFYQQLDLLKFIVAKGLPRAIKAGLHILGEDGGTLRSPLKPLTEAETEELRLILSHIHTPVTTAEKSLIESTFSPFIIFLRSAKLFLKSVNLQLNSELSAYKCLKFFVRSQC